jgi:hypothetical protein
LTITGRDQSTSIQKMKIISKHFYLAKSRR